ncbi:MAG: tRNA(Ile)-lysidine synthase, partial [Sphingobacteriales bacterium]
VNYQLRGQDSQDDEQFCLAFADKYNLRIEVKKVTVPPNVNMEEFARDSRFSFFDKISKENNNSLIALGHHANDQAETILYKLAKGTGIKGLRGMKGKAGRIVRPFLEVAKADILKYCISEGLAYREDLSNRNEAFSRNKIRHSVVPVIETINPSFVNTLASHARDLHEMEKWVKAKVSEEKKYIVKKTASGFALDVDKAIKTEGGLFVVKEIFKEFGVLGAGFEAFIDDPKTGSEFEMNGHTVLFNRGELVLQNSKVQTPIKVIVNDFEKNIILDSGEISIDLFLKGVPSLKAKESELFLSKPQLKYPLKIRSWQDGDWFIPFGMKGKKKVSDFLIDQKVSRFEKQDTLILENGNGDIIWVIGKRGDNRYKVNNQTTEIYKLALK